MHTCMYTPCAGAGDDHQDDDDDDDDVGFGANVISNAVNDVCAGESKLQSLCDF